MIVRLGSEWVVHLDAIQCVVREGTKVKLWVRGYNRPVSEEGITDADWAEFQEAIARFAVARAESWRERPPLL